MNVMVAGTYVIRNRTAIMIRIFGTIALASSATLNLEMLQPTYRMFPTGGVIRPIQRFTTMTTPKYTGSRPNLVTMGNSIGAMISSAGVRSMTQPTISRRMLTTSIRMIVLFPAKCNRW